MRQFDASAALSACSARSRLASDVPGGGLRSRRWLRQARARQFSTVPRSRREHVSRAFFHLPACSSGDAVHCVLRTPVLCPGGPGQRRQHRRAAGGPWIEVLDLGRHGEDARRPGARADHEAARREGNAPGLHRGDQARRGRRAARLRCRGHRRSDRGAAAHRRRVHHVQQLPAVPHGHAHPGQGHQATAERGLRRLLPEGPRGDDTRAQ